MQCFSRILYRRREQISAWRRARLTNSPGEATNNLVKRVERVAFGLTNCSNHRTRALVYVGRPSWPLLIRNAR